MQAALLQFKHELFPDEMAAARSGVTSLGSDSDAHARFLGLFGDSPVCLARLMPTALAWPSKDLLDGTGHVVLRATLVRFVRACWVCRFGP